MPNGIFTIADLERATPEEIEEVRRSINIAGIVMDQLKADSERKGLTYDEYEKHLKTRHKRKEICGTCYGKGKVLPYKRSCGTIHASSAHKCRTRLYYDVVAEDTPIDIIPPELQFVFAIGHAIHETTQNALAKALGDAFHEEVRVDLDEAFVRGSSVDGVIELPNCRVVLEIKTIGKEFANITKPYHYHRLQAMGIYATALDAPFVSTLYVEKTYPNSLKEFVEVYDPSIYENWWKNKGSKVETGLETGTPPWSDSDKWECLECRYASTCTQFFDPRKRKTFKR